MYGITIVAFVEFDDVIGLDGELREDGLGFTTEGTVRLAEHLRDEKRGGRGEWGVSGRRVEV